LPAFFTLPFQAAAGSETLLKAIEIQRALDAGTRGALTTNDPHDFVLSDWRPHLITGGKLDRGIWEISLAFAARHALRSGGLFLTESRDHVSFWNLVYDDRSWQQAREQAYQRLDLPIDGQIFIAKITAEFDRAARAAQRGMPGNRFASIVNDRLKLKKRDALAISHAVRELRATIGASLPRVRIEDALVHGSGVHDVFRPTRISPDPDGDRHAEACHPIENVASNSRLGPLIGQSPGMESPANDGLVAKHRGLNQTSSIVT
jgi:hypothetical protein